MRRTIAASVLLLGGCVAPGQAPPPTPAPVTRPAPPPAPAPIAADWRDRPYSPGDWSYVGQIARYAGLAIACDTSTRQVRLSWAGALPGPLTVRTSYGDAVRQMQPGGTLSLAPRDPLLDQIAYSRGRFMLAAGGQELIAPAWPEIQKVIEDCR